MKTRNYDFSRFFAQVKSPTPDSRKKTEEYIRHYESRPDRDTFYVIFDLRPPIHLKWTCNLRQVLGYQQFTAQQLLDEIHPEWKEIYYEFTHAAYSWVSSVPKEVLPNMSYHFNLPIKHADGHYIWLRHYSEPLEYDVNGKLVSHFSLYRYIEDYQGYLQMRPMVM
ncbi:MAG: hypothetical protein AAFU67_05770, partial [Bacteroidota bacterium]